MRSRKRNALIATITTLSTMGIVVFGAGGARADYGPSTYNSSTATGDVVCVGSDTVQVIGDFLADGNESGTGQGYNTTSNGKYKFISLDATADANVRVAYSVTSSADTNNFRQLSPTVVLRAGQFPAQRPNGSGAGLNALLNDVTESVNAPPPNQTVTNTYSEKVNCVRMSSIPSLAQFNSASGQGWGGLHLIRAADDNLQVASLPTTTSNVPATLSRPQLIAIYGTPGIAHWSDLPGGYTPPNPAATVGTTGNCPSCSPNPLLPQSGSGTRNQFLQDLCVGSAYAGCTGGPPTSLSTITTTVNQNVEENDPTALTGQTDSADALAPFSGDRLALWNTGAFHNPFTASKNSTASVPAGPGVSFPPVGDPAYPGGATLNPGIALLGTGIGAASDGNSGYLDTRGLWFVYRAVDDNDPAWQPGSTKNWAATLFSTGSFLGTSFRSAADVNAASGNKYDFVDCGTNQANWASTTGCFNNVQ